MSELITVFYPLFSQLPGEKILCVDISCYRYVNISDNDCPFLPSMDIYQEVT